jgi:hypothetical protein
MSPNRNKFLDRCLRGTSLADEIDDFVDAWHESDSELPLSEFLGFTPEEYSIWVEMPNSLEWILYARKTRRPIGAILSEVDTASPRLAARSLSPEDADELVKWLKRTGRL